MQSHAILMLPVKMLTEGVCQAEEKLRLLLSWRVLDNLEGPTVLDTYLCQNPEITLHSAPYRILRPWSALCFWRG